MNHALQRGEGAVKNDEGPFNGQYAVQGSVGQSTKVIWDVRCLTRLNFFATNFATSSSSKTLAELSQGWDATMTYD